MTIASVNTWVFGDKLTFGQLNSLDGNTTSALDKRSGQTDTLASVVTCGTTGRIIANYEIGANADHTYALSDGISVIDATAGLSAHRAYTLSNTGAATNDMVAIYAGTTWNVTVKNDGGTSLYIVGGTGAAHGTWAVFRHDGTDWKLFQSPTLFYPSKKSMFLPETYCATARDSTEFATTVDTDTFDIVSSTQIDTIPNYSKVRLKTVNTASSKSYAYRQRLNSSILPQGHKLTSVVMKLTGAAAHGGLPQQMPGLLVCAHQDSGTILTMLSTGWAIDSSGTTGAYQAAHTVTFTPDQNNTIDHSAYSYDLFVLGEGGSNALANLTIQNFTFNFSLL